MYNEKFLASKSISHSERNYKYFIWYLYNDFKVKPLNIMLLKMSAYVNSYNWQIKLDFLIKDDDLLEKYNTVWDKVSFDIKK